MMKRVLSLILCLGMIAGVLLMAGCGNDTPTTAEGTLPATINMLGITEESTTPEAIKAVENAINKISTSRYKTKINLTLVTADEYIALIEERTALAVRNQTELSAIGRYNTLAQREANNAEKLLASQKKKTSKWTKKVTSVIASTLSTGEVYSAEETTVYEDGRIETLYPDARSPIDIVMIVDKEMYDYLDGKGYLLSIQNRISSSTEFTKFRQYIYPTFFEQLQAVTGDIKAIPNNKLLANYTYLLVDKALADKYDFDVDSVDGYDDLDAAVNGGEGFLAQIKKNESVVPMAVEPDALGIYKYFDGDIAVGTYFHPIYGYSASEGTDFAVQNLFSIPQYRAHMELMEEYRANGYFDAVGTDNFAVTVIKGDASVEAEYSDRYYVKVLQNPFVEVNSLFDGMMAVSTYTADEKRALEVLEMINTDPEVKNLLQYGIAYNGDNDDVANYRVNTIQKEDGSVSYSITRLNHNYMMNNALTGNVYMGYPEEGQSIDAWTYYKQTNLNSDLAPFLRFYLTDVQLDGMLDSILRRAAMTEVLTAAGLNYDDYENNAPGTTQGDVLRRTFKQYYKEYFIELLDHENLPKRSFTVVTKNSASDLENDFVNFILSAEGQQILKSVGYTPLTSAPVSYEKKASMSGTLKICANMTATALTSYFEDSMKKLSAAYQAMYPDVTIELPKRNNNNAYQDDMVSVANGSYEIGFISRDLIASEISRGIKGTLIATDYFDVFNFDSHAVYGVSWYENKMIEKLKAEKYADIVSASGLSALVANQYASLAGIDLSKYSAATRPASESAVFETAKKNASAYYTNISYLRVMAELLLWDELPESDLQAYRALNDAEFETAVFNYVRANYEKEHNITDADYEKLVRDYMVSVLEYTDPADNSSTYRVSWDEFQQTKEKAQVYLKAAGTIKEAYLDKLNTKIGAPMVKLLSLPELMDEVYTIMYEEYLAANGLSKTAFENSIKDKYLKAVGTTAEDFASYTKTSDEYKNYVSKLRKKYKNILVEAFSLNAYKKGETGITNDEVLSTLFSHFLEEEIKIYDQMCALAGVSYDDFVAAEQDMSNYERYLNTMKTMFTYTLRTQYTVTQINAWSYEEVEANLYKVLYDVGFYTNEMARYIGQTLSEYMLAKSNAVTYQSYLRTAANALADELKAKGYTVADLLKEDKETIESVCKEIVLEKYFGDKVNIEDSLTKISGSYMTGLENASDVSAYFDDTSKALSSDYFFMAVISELQAAWQESKAS